MIKPKLLIIAGPNGTGKTSLTDKIFLACHLANFLLFRFVGKAKHYTHILAALMTSLLYPS